jgi:FixJ family two-component response regulator
MNKRDEIVFVVDDDHCIREDLYELLTCSGLRVVTFASAAEYIAFARPDLPACLVLEMRLPDIHGLELQRQLSDGYHPPIVFITGHGDILSSVRAIKAGAVDFLAKPFNQVDLMTAINTAIDQDSATRLARAELSELRQRFSSLTPREREVLPLVVSGLLNKQAAAELGISEITIQIHRSKVMQKMLAGSLPELVRMAEKLKVPLTHSRRAVFKPNRFVPSLALMAHQA